MLSRLIFSVRNGGIYYVRSTVQKNERRAFPEEIIRQLFVLSLVYDYKYPEDRICLEYQIQIGRERKRADIVVLDENGGVLVIIETKVETDHHSMGQLKSYMLITGAQYGALISVSKMECIQMLSPREVSIVRDIPLFDASSSSFPDILPKTNAEDSTDSALSSDRQMPLEGAAGVGQGFSLKQSIGIEQFVRVSNSHAKITIRGTTLLVANDEICRYTALRKLFLRVGIGLISDVTEAAWAALLNHFLETNPMPTRATAPRDSISILAEYLNAYIAERLVVTRFNVGIAALPTKELSQRYEKDTHTLLVSRTHIRTYLGKNHVDYNQIRDDLIARGVLLNPKVMRTLGAGTGLAGGPMACWQICANHKELGALVFEHP